MIDLARSSSMRPQTAISSRDRWQPSHNPSAPMRHTLVHGEIVATAPHMARRRRMRSSVGGWVLNSRATLGPCADWRASARGLWM